MNEFLLKIDQIGLLHYTRGNRLSGNGVSVQMLKQFHFLSLRSGLRIFQRPQPNHISKSAIAALTFPAAPAAIIRVVAIGTAHRLARNAARTSFSGGWSRTD